VSGRHWVRAAYVVMFLACLVALIIVNANDPYHGM
jgi:hypothetical protein